MDVLYVVRHGQTEWNLVGRFQGRLDSPLTESGVRHAERHGALLHGERVERLIASPLGRARTTAELINTRLGVELELDERLIERDCGAWSGLAIEDIAREFPREWEERARSPYFHRPPGGGENLEDMLARVRPLLDGLHQLSHRRVALVSHGIMGRVILSCLLGIDPADTNAVRQPNDVVYRLTLGRGGTRCEYFTDGDGPVEGFATRAALAE